MKRGGRLRKRPLQKTGGGDGGGRYRKLTEAGGSWDRTAPGTVLRAVFIIRQNAIHNKRCEHCSLYGHGHAVAVAPLPLLLLYQCMFIIIL